jgi:hypothetical protein
VLSKRKIETTIEHMRIECAQHGSPENETWIKALEWVLGSKEHRESYDDWLANLETMTATSHPALMAAALKAAIEHLK